MFCLSEVRIGLVPATIAPYVVRAMGRRQAQRYMLTASRFDAAEAYRIGLAHEVVPSEAIDLAVERTVRSLVAGGPQALARTKMLLHEVHGRLAPELIEATATCIAEVRGSAEGKEGLASFLEKRKPAWALG